MMWSSMAVLQILLAVAGAQGFPNAATVPSASFVGTWVGTQSWAIENPPPNARGDQLVELSIEMVNGRLTGTMRPWFGGDDGATFTVVNVVGEELRATAVIGKPADPGQRVRRDWKSAVTIHFTFRTQPNNELVGTADVMLDGTRWMRFQYDLGRKRSRY